MKIIKLKFVDCGEGFDENNNFFIDILNEKYDVRIVEDPDYIIYSVWGMEHLKYNCIRIFYTLENVRPNFNVCDYAMGFDYITYEDRYIRIPSYLFLEQYRSALKRALNNKMRLENDEIQSRRFCNFIYSNGNAEPEREKFFNELSKYKKVDSGGRYLNNIGVNVENKYEFQKQYKFSIAFENSIANGYTTEKIVEAFGSGTVPIYWGNPRIGEEFNEKAFINCHQYKSFDEVIDLIIKIDNNNELYRDYLKEPIFINNSLPKELQKDYINEFFFNIFDKSFEDAKKRADWWFDLIENIKVKNKMKFSEKEKHYKYFVKMYLQNKKIIGWGSGEGLDILMKYDNEINFQYLVDSNDLKVGTNKNGLSIYSPKELLNEDKEEIFIIILSSNYYEEIKKKLLEYNFEEYKNFICFDFFEVIDELETIEKI